MPCDGRSAGVGGKRATSMLIPKHWSGQQALAVIEVLDALRDGVWDVYGRKIQRALRRQYGQESKQQVQASPIDEWEVPF